MEDLTTLLPKLASIYGLAFFYFWPAVPAGLALGLPPLLVVITATASYISGVLVALILGNRARALWRRWRHQESPAAVAPPSGRLCRVWDRYGLAGLGLLAPMTIGSQTGALVAVALSGRPRAILVWMSIGALGWSIGLCLVALLGQGLLAT